MSANKVFVAAMVMGALLVVSCTPVDTREFAKQDSAYLFDRRIEANSENACLQNNRIWGWRVLDERTLVVNDINNDPFLVRLSGGCIGLTDANIRIAFRTSTRLGCLAEGDELLFRDPTLGRMSCFVTNVEPFADRHYAQDYRPFSALN